MLRQKDLSYLTSSNLKVEVKSTNRLYFGQYRYCASAYLPYASCLRRQSHYHIDAQLELRETLHQSYPDLRALVNGQYLRNPPITTYVKNDLHLFLDKIQNINDNFKMVYKKHNFYCYTNSTAVIDEVLEEGLLDRRLTQLKIDYEPGSIVRKNSDYKYRCYMRATQVAEQTKESMRRFFNTHPELSLGRSFQQWLKSPYKYSSSHFFFDHNDEGMHLMFELTAPGVMRELYTIITEDKLNHG